MAHYWHKIYSTGYPTTNLVVSPYNVVVRYKYFTGENMDL